MTVGFQMSSYTVLEEGRSVNVCVIASLPAERSFIIVLQTFPETAVGKLYSYL